jgi:hypothetical protein
LPPEGLRRLSLIDERSLSLFTGDVRTTSRGNPLDTPLGLGDERRRVIRCDAQPGRHQSPCSVCVGAHTLIG